LLVQTTLPHAFAPSLHFGQALQPFFFADVNAALQHFRLLQGLLTDF
jgi:hypothetical protein